MFRVSVFICSMTALALSACSDGDRTHSDERNPAHTISTSNRDSEPEAFGENASLAPWQLIGSQLEDPAVKAYVSELPGSPEREEFPDYGVFLSFYKEGIELSADTTGKLMTVIIYGPGADRYDVYSGPMPRSLAWTMSRSDVENVIGQPTDQSFSRNSATGHHEFYAEYPSLGMYLNYIA